MSAERKKIVDIKLCQPTGSALTVDLYHNPHARVPIPHRLAANLVRKQYGERLVDPDRQEPTTVLDLMRTTEWQRWLDDPEGKCDREIEACLCELRVGQAPLTASIGSLGESPMVAAPPAPVTARGLDRIDFKWTGLTGLGGRPGSH
jgi:hypothetical protein